LAYRFAFATWSGLPEGSPDDLGMGRELTERGHVVLPAVWDDPGVDWGSFDVVVIRSTWDYNRRRPAFLDWVHRCARASRLWNPETTVVWNSHKSYLADLGAAGVRVIPTEPGRPGESLEELCRRRGWRSVVVKPMVGAAAEGAHFVDEDHRADFEPTYAARLREGEQMVQPFIEGVLAPGERSLVHIDGEFTHAFSKGAALPVDRRESEGYRIVEAGPEERALAERALASVRPTPLYARVDVVAGPGGEPLLMELELLEPYLHLQGSALARDRFARALLSKAGA